MDRVDEDEVNVLYMSLLEISPELSVNNQSALYDSISVDEKDCIVLTKDEEVTIPETVYCYTVEITEVNYNALALAYYYGWF